ncbi:MAG: LPS export ABC transporter permease LptF [Deltaproteobacteria bacterium]
MKKIIHLYLFREIAVPFFFGFAVFTLVLLMGKLLNLAELVISKEVPVSDILRLIAYMLPSFCVVTIPMSFLLALLLAFGRLSADCEITAMKTSKISIYGLLPPVLIFATLTFIATMYITVYALPWGNRSFKIFLYESIKAKVTISLREKAFNDEFPGMVVYVDRYDKERHLISDILIYDDRNIDEPSTIFAKSGVIVTDPDKKLVRLSLKNGSIHRNPEKFGYRLIEFASYDLSINFNKTAGGVKSDRLDMTLAELLKNIRSAPAGSILERDLLLEFHKRLSLPFACFVFALIGVPLGMQNHRSGKAVGFSMSIGVILVNYILISIGKTLGQKGILIPSVAMWLPNITLLTIGIYLFKKTADEEKIFLFEIIPLITRRTRILALNIKKSL